MAYPQPDPADDGVQLQVTPARVGQGLAALGTERGQGVGLGLQLFFEPAAGPFAALGQDGLFQRAQGLHRNLRSG